MLDKKRKQARNVTRYYKELLEKKLDTKNGIFRGYMYKAPILASATAQGRGSYDCKIDEVIINHNMAIY